MDTLQISPVVGFKPAAAPAGTPAGEASSPHSDSKSAKSTSTPTAIFNANGPTQEQLVATRESATRTAERAAELKAEEEKKAARAKEAEKALDLKVGMVSGDPGKVFIDIVDPKLGRTVYRVFGPPGEETPPAEHDAGAKAASAYSRPSAPDEQPANVKTEV
jgi:hypothetical protein